MAIESLRDFAAEVGTALLATRTTLDDVIIAVEDGAVTAARLANLRASLTGHRLALRALRSELDATDVSTLQVHERADRTLALWAWERKLRVAVLKIEDRCRVLDAIAADVALGIRRQVYVVRAGETLQAIAARLLGDWREWPRLVEANGLAPGAIAAGTVLLIPDRR
jgi:nucleoid-associated protein YgaU